MFTCLAAGYKSVRSTQVSAALKAVTWHSNISWSVKTNLTNSHKHRNWNRFEMLSWVTPCPVNAVTSNLTSKPTRGASVFVFSYNVEKCCTAQGGNCTPPRKNTWGGNTFLYFLLFQHKSTPEQKNSLLVEANTKQWPPNLQISHLHIQIFDLTRDEWDSLSVTTIKLYMSTWFSASPSSWGGGDQRHIIYVLKVHYYSVFLDVQQEGGLQGGKGSVHTPSWVFSDKWFLVRE